MLNGLCLVCQGHGPVVSAPVALIEGYLAHRQQREDQIKAALSVEPLTIPQIVAKVGFKSPFLMRKKERKL